MEITFYIGVPIALGLIFGLQRAGVGMLLDLRSSVLFWTVTCFCAWIANDIGTRAAAAMMRPMRAPLWGVLLVGVLVGHLLNFPTWEWRAEHLIPDNVARSAALPRPGLDADYLLTIGRSLLISFALWLGANYAALAGFGLPRYGYCATRAAEPPTVSEAEQSAISIADPDRVIAIQAQQHYVVIHRPEGRQLVQMRFSDAERMMGPTRGCRVHRSFWVAQHAIESVARDGASTRLRLRGGLEVPVGRTYLLNLRQRGLASV